MQYLNYRSQCWRFRNFPVHSFAKTDACAESALLIKDWLFESLELRPIMNKRSKLSFYAVNFITFRINYSVKNFCNFAFILNFALFYIYRLRFSPASGGWWENDSSYDGGWSSLCATVFEVCCFEEWSRTEFLNVIGKSVCDNFFRPSCPSKFFSSKDEKPQ